MSLIDNEFLENIPKKIKRILIYNNIFTKEDLINFASQYQLRKLKNIGLESRISDNLIRQIKNIIPNITCPIDEFYSNFTPRTVNNLKRFDVSSKKDLIKLLSNKRFTFFKYSYGVGKKTIEEINNYLANN